MPQCLETLEVSTSTVSSTWVYHKHTTSQIHTYIMWLVTGNSKIWSVNKHCGVITPGSAAGLSSFIYGQLMTHTDNHTWESSLPARVLHVSHWQGWGAVVSTVATVCSCLRSCSYWAQLQMRCPLISQLRLNVTSSQQLQVQLQMMGFSQAQLQLQHISHQHLQLQA